MLSEIHGILRIGVLHWIFQCRMDNWVAKYRWSGYT